MTMTEYIKQVNDVLRDFIWGRGMLIIFLAVGLLFTVRTGFFQFRKWRVWLGMTLGQLFRNRKVRRTDDEQSMSQFQAFCTALAATLGTGNITGVATALIAGGPGAIFWMWISAVVGMMTMYAENVLGILYRYKNRSGRWVGGAMVYMERGLGCKWLAVLFAVFCILASLGMGNMTQANAMAGGLKEAFYVPTFVTGLAAMVLVGMVLFGGVRRIATVTERLIPLISLFYIAGGIIVLAANAAEIPKAFQLIFTEAFKVQSVGGGVLGYGMRQAMKTGISRGVFSNEAGLGSSVMAHAASDIDSAPVQGMWAIVEVFIDTIVFCTVTALVILTSGVYDQQGFLANIARGAENVDGTTLCGRAFATVIPGGDKFLALSMIFFAFATIIGWAYFGERTFAYLFGERSAIVYKLIYIVVLLPGCVIAPGLVWEIADTFNGFMAVPNLTALILLSGQVVRVTKEYMRN
ncbi:amino acid carrier protein [Dorea sp. D27]|nr:sodium:alanine symporter family protein [Dorea sp. D27]KMZ52398.1 amino acid carrier protein [Dorea sp. D27]